MRASFLTVALLLVTSCKKDAAPAPASAPKPSAIAEKLRARVQAQAPHAKVSIVNDGKTVRAEEGDWVVDLGLENLTLSCTSDAACDGAVDNALGNFKSMYAMRAADGGRGALDKAKILFALKDAEWLAQVDKLLREKPDKYEDNKLLLDPWLGSLSLVMVLDEPTGMRMLQHSDLKALGLTAPEVSVLAKKNLAAMFPKLTPMEEVKNSGVWTNSEDENYASALLVLPELWAPLAKKVDGKLVVALPARNRVFATGDTSAARIELMAKVVAQTVKEQDHPLVTTLFDWSTEGFKVRK